MRNVTVDFYAAVQHMGATALGWGFLAAAGNNSVRDANRETMMNANFGDMHRLAADQALELLHFHFHYGMGATPNEHAAVERISGVTSIQPQAAKIRVAN